MPNQQLIDYITQRKALGADEFVIMRELTAAGWNPDEVSKTLQDLAGAKVAARTVTPNKIPSKTAKKPHSTKSDKKPSSTNLENILNNRKKLLMPVGIPVLIVIIIATALFVHFRLAQDNLPSNLPNSSVMAGSSTTPIISRAAVDPSTLNNISPSTFLTNWNFSNIPAGQRSQYYQATPLSNGTTQREYWITATQKTITIAHGVTFKAWAYDGQVPGPTLRANQGDPIIVHFTNDTSMKHNIDFGSQTVTSSAGGSPYAPVAPGASVTYSFRAGASGLIVYNDSTDPEVQNVNEGLYGSMIIDPDGPQTQSEKLVMTINAFDTQDPVGDSALLNGDGTNDVYGFNTVAFWYQNHPISVKVGQLYQIYVSNVVNFDPNVTFHIDGTFFRTIPQGTVGTSPIVNDLVNLGTYQTAIIDVTFNSPGQYRVYSFSGGFVEKGLLGTFNASN